MYRAASPVRNVTLWLLALFSGAMALLGAWIIADKLPAMVAVLDDGTATPSQVYGGQSWVAVGAAILGAGIIGLALALAVGALTAGARAAAPAPLDPIGIAADERARDGDVVVEPTADGLSLDRPVDDETVDDRPAAEETVTAVPAQR